MNNRFWQKDVETAHQDEILALQEKKFKETFDRVYKRSAFYGNKFKQPGISANRIASLNDIEELPFTTRSEIFDDQSVHGKLGTTVCADSKEPGQAIGQTGDRFSFTDKPLKVLVTLKDLADQGKMAARGLVAAGIDNRDYLYIADFPQLNLIYMHMGLGSINAGSKSLLIGMERAERNIRIYMELYPPTAFFISPSYARFMGTLIKETQSEFPVSTILGWNEVGYSLPGVRAQLESMWGEVSTEPQVKAYDVYGMIETGLLGYECPAQNGLHTFEDSYIYEIIDPEAEECLDYGEEGELVVTHLDREGMPLIRYRTGDITRIEKEPCGCGRTHARLMGIKGRWSERLIVKGTTLYPSQVEEAMSTSDGYVGAYHIAINGSREVDSLEIAMDQDRIDANSKGALQTHLESHLGVPVILRAVSGTDLFVYPHRSHRVIDYSKKDMYLKQLKMQITAEE